MIWDFEKWVWWQNRSGIQEYSEVRRPVKLLPDERDVETLPV